jgi:hypothetical protein
MLGGLWLYQLSAMGVKQRKSSGFVGSHELAITDDIGRKDCRKSPILVLRFHRSLPMYERCISAPPQS